MVLLLTHALAFERNFGCGYRVPARSIPPWTYDDAPTLSFTNAQQTPRWKYWPVCLEESTQGHRLRHYRPEEVLHLLDHPRAYFN